ncbi:MAG: hypothetical protein R3314_12045 [Longimicrobiales bacterium]|nr:hypothetical protein [Longimicrobiales bacterium]
MNDFDFDFDFESVFGSEAGFGFGSPFRSGSGFGSGAGRARGAGAAVAAVGLLLAFLLAAMPAAGQDVRGLLGSDTARVGDVVPVVVPVPVAPGERVVWPDTLPVTGDLENAARVTERVDTLADGQRVRTGVYAVTPWRTGELSLPVVTVEVVGGGESPRTTRAVLPALTVVSVLPPDTTGVEPRPARGVLGPSWAWTTILLLVLALLAAIAVLVWWWRRRRPGDQAVEPLAPRIPPRERALAMLDAARKAGLLERGEVKEFYTRFSDAVRDYMAALEPGWGEDLTTTELLSRLRAQVGPSEAAGLREVLDPADRVKFARREPDGDTAVAEWEAARQWVLAFDWPPRREPVTEEAA